MGATVVSECGGAARSLSLPNMFSILWRCLVEDGVVGDRGFAVGF